MAFPEWSHAPHAFPFHPDYHAAIRTHNATLARLRTDCCSCAADYREADRVFTEALRALPDYPSEPVSHWRLE